MYNINGYSNYTAVSIPKQSTKRWKSIILFEICAIRWIQCVQREAATHTKKCTAIILAVVLALTAVGCSQNGELGEQLHSASLLTLGELTEIGDREKIGNQIPEWVSEADWNKSFYVVSSSDIERFDAYAQENFPNYCDGDWTQEQSDSVYLGQGIEMFALDDETPINRIIYYPVILNGVIVDGYQVCELENQEITMQGSPYLVNELNVMIDLTSEETPLILGFNNNNTIGIIGDTYYVLDIDHMYHKEVAVNKIPAIEFSTCVNAMEVLCAERIANVDDWVIIP